jgi:hypothetical protein
MFVFFGSLKVWIHVVDKISFHLFLLFKSFILLILLDKIIIKKYWNLKKKWSPNAAKIILLLNNNKIFICLIQNFQ